jgi:hypothetical protein
VRERERERERWFISLTSNRLTQDASFSFLLNSTSFLLLGTHKSLVSSLAGLFHLSNGLKAEKLSRQCLLSLTDSGNRKKTIPRHLRHLPTP